jgi:ubiquinone/menaquinone biosynthesis C-methylase UbiE
MAHDHDAHGTPGPHDHPGGHGHKFDPAHAGRLDDPTRRALMPPERLAAALDLTDGDRVGDVGCGTGYWLFAMLDAAPAGTTFHALDSEPLMLDLLAGRLRDHPAGGRVQAHLSTEQALPLPDASLDVVVLGNVYHELHDRAAYLRELHRVLAPGGRLAVIDWAPLAEGEEWTSGPPLHERIARTRAQAEFAAAGFEASRDVEGFTAVWCVISRRA